MLCMHVKCTVIYYLSISIEKVAVNVQLNESSIVAASCEFARKLVQVGLCIRLVP